MSYATFRFVYPNAWPSFHATYTSDKPDASDYQFKDAEVGSRLQIPNIVNVIANRVDEADGTWDEAQIVTGEFP